MTQGKDLASQSRYQYGREIKIDIKYFEDLHHLHITSYTPCLYRYTTVIKEQGNIERWQEGIRKETGKDRMAEGRN